MRMTWIKTAIVTGTSLAFYVLCRYLLVPPLYLSMLVGWGLFCFLFSYELAGRRTRVRNGIEEKTPLQLAWMVAGIVCIVTAWVVLFRWF